MFRLIEPSSGQIQNTVLVHSVSAHLRVHSLNVPVLCFVFGLMMAQWAETCRRIFNIDYQLCCVYWLNKLLYYTIWLILLKQLLDSGLLSEYSGVCFDLFISSCSKVSQISSLRPAYTAKSWRKELYRLHSPSVPSLTSNIKIMTLVALSVWCGILLIFSLAFEVSLIHFIFAWIRLISSSW